MDTVAYIFIFRQKSYLQTTSTFPNKVHLYYSLCQPQKEKNKFSNM